MPSKFGFALIALTSLLSAEASGQEVVTRPNIVSEAGAKTVTLNGQTFIHQGLVGTGSLPASTLDFLGDTLGSFSSLQIAPGSWKRVGNRYEGVLWTLPDRGRNDPAAKVFFDYLARLVRMRIRFTPRTGKVEMTPAGGIELKDFSGKPFTGADPDSGAVLIRGHMLPAPASGVGAGKVSLDAESLQFRRDGSFYVGDEYSANVYYFSKTGWLQGVIAPPAAVKPMRNGVPFEGSLEPPATGRRNNQGVEGMSLSPDGKMLFVALQSALIQDSASGNAAGRINTRVLVYDVSRDAAPKNPVAHYVVQLPAYTADGDGGAPNRTAAQSEIRAIDSKRFLMLARDGAGLGAGKAPIVYKSVLLVDLAGATNFAGSDYETGTVSLLENPASVKLKPGITPAATTELVNLLNPAQLAKFGLSVPALSEKWEAMDLVPVLERGKPNDYFLIVGNDNDFTARRCLMSGQTCDSEIDNDNRLLVYRLTLPVPLR